METIMKNENIIDLIIISSIISITEQFAQYFLKKSKYKHDFCYIFGILIYIFVAYLFHYTHNRYNINKVNIIWACMAILFSLITGYFFENELITTNKIIAALLALTAIYFVQ